jgi:tetratricopeptide (TPR) repeat protein
VHWEKHAGHNIPPTVQLSMDDSTADIPLNPPPLPADNMVQLRAEKDRVDALARSTSVGALQHAAEAAMDMGDLWRAEAITRSILKDKPDDPLAKLTLAASLRMQQRTDDAMQIYLELLRQDSHDTDAYIGLADTTFAANNRPQTFAWLARGVKDGVQTPRALIAIAHRYQDWKDFPNAEEAASRALQIDPSNIDTLLELASVQVESGELDAGYHTLESVFKTDPENEFAVRLMGVVLMNASYSHQDLNRARSLLEHAVELNVKDPDIYSSVAVIYRHQHLYRLAAQAYDALLHLQPASLDARYGLGHVYALLGKPEQSREQLAIYKFLDDRAHRAVRLKEDATHNPRSAETHAAIARLMEKGGDYAAALPQYQTAASLKPNSRAITDEINRFYARLGWLPPTNFNQ